MDKQNFYERDYSDDEEYIVVSENEELDDESSSSDGTSHVGHMSKYSSVFNMIINLMKDVELGLDIRSHLDHTAFTVGDNEVLKVSKNYWPDLNKIPREIRILHILEDVECVVNLNSFFISEVDKSYAIVMDRIVETPVEDDQKVDFVKQMFAGLAEIHAHGIIHRDISSGNVLWSDGKIKFIDFNLSCFDDEKHKHYRSCGTSSYTALEVYERQGYDSKIDVYSAGVVALKVIIGECDLLDQKEYFARHKDECDMSNFFHNVLHHNSDKRLTAQGACSHNFLKMNK